MVEELFEEIGEEIEEKTKESIFFLRKIYHSPPPELVGFIVGVGVIVIVPWVFSWVLDSKFSFFFFSSLVFFLTLPSLSSLLSSLFSPLSSLLFTPSLFSFLFSSLFSSLSLFSLLSSLFSLLSSLFSLLSSLSSLSPEFNRWWARPREEEKKEEGIRMIGNWGSRQKGLELPLPSENDFNTQAAHAGMFIDKYI